MDDAVAACWCSVEHVHAAKLTREPIRDANWPLGGGDTTSFDHGTQLALRGNCRLPTS
jgi:hypothetical protein